MPNLLKTISLKFFSRRKTQPLSQPIILHHSYIKGGEPFFVDRGSDVGALLLHGFSATPYEFKDLVEFLSQRGLTVYAPVIAGHGTTPQDLENVGIEDFKRSAWDAMSYLKRKVNKVIIVGNSFGGNLAFHLAAHYPQTPAGVVSLGTPIYMRRHYWRIFRIYSYGWFKTFYRKPAQTYKAEYVEHPNVVSYPLIPVKSLRDFVQFILFHTKPILPHVSAPTFIVQASGDPIVHPQSAQYLHEKLGCGYKKVYWINDERHNIMNLDAERRSLFENIYEFIKEMSEEEQNKKKGQIVIPPFSIPF